MHGKDRQQKDGDFLKLIGENLEYVAVSLTEFQWRVT